MIGGWQTSSDESVFLQDFIQDGERFFPVFSSVEIFDAEVDGSGFEDQGIIIKKDLLASILHGDELLILNPGGRHPRRLTKADLLT